MRITSQFPILQGFRKKELSALSCSKVLHLPFQSAHLPNYKERLMRIRLKSCTVNLTRSTREVRHCSRKMPERMRERAFSVDNVLKMTVPGRPGEQGAEYPLRGIDHPSGSSV